MECGPPSIQILRDASAARNGSSFFGKKPTDHKVRGFVLERIGQKGQDLRGALHPTTSASKVMVDLLSALAISPIEPSTAQLLPVFRRKRALFLRRRGAKRIPIGLRSSRPHGWINAWMQFFLFMPRAFDLLSFVPHSLTPFRAFAEQYLTDQEEGREISFANGHSLLRPFLRLLPRSFFLLSSHIDPYQLFSSLLRAISSFPLPSILCHPEWHLSWDSSFEKRAEPLRFPELFVSVSSKTNGIKRQFFTLPETFCYELDAFIEYRRPHPQEEAIYATYLKVNGIWYQCEDERITALLSTSLPAALCNSSLLHYTKLDPLPNRIF